MIRLLLIVVMGVLAGCSSDQAAQDSANCKALRDAASLEEIYSVMGKPKHSRILEKPERTLVLSYSTLPAADGPISLYLKPAGEDYRLASKYCDLLQ